MNKEEFEDLERKFRNAEMAMIVYQIRENERWEAARNVFEAWEELKRWRPERAKIVQPFLELREIYEKHRGRR